MQYSINFKPLAEVKNQYTRSEPDVLCGMSVCMQALGGARVVRPFAATSLFAVLLCGAAHAGTFDVPYDAPKLTITVPDKWSPNHSDEGVDAAAPDNSVFFSIYTSQASDAAAVQRDSLAILTRNGITIEKEPSTETASSFGGLNWAEREYSATEDGKPKLVRVDASHLSGKLYVQLFIWGTPAGMKKNIASLNGILSTIKLKSH
jgi:hypothetical protein